MTPREIFYLVFGAGVAFVLFLVLRKRKKKEQTISKPTPQAALEVIRDNRPEILEEVDAGKIAEAAAAPVAAEPAQGPYGTDDLLGLLAAYGTVNETWNLNQSPDGIVNSGDLLILLANYGAPAVTHPNLVPAWNNFYNHAPASNPNAGFALVPVVLDEGKSWNDFKDDCTVQWFYNGVLCSEDKDKCPFVEAVTNAGLCSGQFPLTCRITHTPTGKIYERTACSHINLTEAEGWFEINPDMQDCDTECSIATVENLWAGPFDDYEFLIN